MAHHHHRRRKNRQSDISRRTKPGASPGVVVVDPEASRPKMQVMAFGPTEFIEHADVDLHTVRALVGKHPVLWLNVDGLGDAATIESLGKLFGFHGLALEDVVNTHQRPKVDDYGDHLFIVARMAHGEGQVVSEQLSMFLGKNYVVTFQNLPGDSLEPVRQRLRQSAGGRIRSSGADYLAYALVDAAIDGYYPVIEQVSARLDQLEDEILIANSEDSLERLRALKQDLLSLRRAIWPHREALASLSRGQHAIISDATRVYLRDCYDHVVQIIDLVEVYRELVMDLRDFYMSAISNQINETMRVLTIVSTIFIPLTFIAGVYGMNFKYMPELDWRFGYAFAWLLMIATTAGMLYYFRRQGWIRLRWLFANRRT
jgi:magnesium transporter